MTKNAQRELRTIYRRIQSIPMSRSERQAATAAMREAFIIVEAFAWLTRQVRAVLSLRLTVARREHGF